MDAGQPLDVRPLAAKVVGICAGEAHTLALTAEGEVYSWGRGTFGRLGTGKEEDETRPVRVSFVSGKKGQGCSNKPPRIVAVAAGAYHSLALEDDGSVWSWGYNLYGQLGVDSENSLVPIFLDEFLDLVSPRSLQNQSDSQGKAQLKIVSIMADGMMSFAIDNIGGLWMWGNCPQLSKDGDEPFSLVSIPTPRPVWFLHGRCVVKVECGNEHVVVLASPGETVYGGDLVCYAWGNNNHGQLGLGDNESRSYPEVVKSFDVDSPWSIYEIACGSFHTTVLTRRKPHSPEKDAQELRRMRLEDRASVCWTFGLGDNGQLGHGKATSSSFPEPVYGLPEDVLLKSVDCGLFHTCVASEAGEVWVWGMEKGLGLCPEATFSGEDPGDALIPLKVICNENIDSNFAAPVQVACGAAHTVVAAHDGYRMWAWGRGHSGVLGNGSTANSLVPCTVMWPPLQMDFERKEVLDRKERAKPSESEKIAGAKKGASTLEDIQDLNTKIASMERYINVLHTYILGERFEDLGLPLGPENSVADVHKAWWKMLDSADDGKLNQMKRFYQSMLSAVEEKIMKRKVHEMVRECLSSLPADMKSS
ncbi:ultraviolet-B receptor UVR8 [Nymphaea colorata]|uniref:ultraviolet-B receptor UVR8 n=1 Tax=Nymphaea colorata TaxID=210225 RepID=UPI00129E5AB7|nr:ultraviolet-B receptor UVR8 [Nymphaea colorata]